MKKSLDAVVAIGGRMAVAVKPGMTKETLFEQVREHWGLDLDKTVDPFVVVHDTVMNKHQILDDETLDTVSCCGRYVLRVVLPLQDLS
jgi:hypothetical protein